MNNSFLNPKQFQEYCYCKLNIQRRQPRDRSFVYLKIDIINISPFLTPSPPTTTSLSYCELETWRTFIKKCKLNSPSKRFLSASSFLIKNQLIGKVPRVEQ